MATDAAASDYGYLRIHLMTPKHLNSTAEDQDFHIPLPKTWDPLMVSESKEAQTIANALYSSSETPSDPKPVIYYGANVRPTLARHNIAISSNILSIHYDDYRVPVVLHNEGSCINVFYYKHHADKNPTWFRQVLYDGEFTTWKPALGRPDEKSVLKAEWAYVPGANFMILGDVGEPTSLLLRLECQQVGTKTTPPKALPFYGGLREWAITKIAVFIRPSMLREALTSQASVVIKSDDDGEINDIDWNAVQQMVHAKPPKAVELHDQECRDLIAKAMKD